MQIPKYWSRQSVSKIIKGKKFEISCSGWSDQGLSEARKKALEIAEKVIKAIQKGKRKEHYLYGDRPIKEEILTELSDGEIGAIITRTAYGSLILNTDSIMFIDIDNPNISFSEKIIYRLKVFFGSNDPSPLRKFQENMKKNIEHICKQNYLKIRLYSTFKGFRGIVTNKLFKAGSSESEKILKKLKSDYLYIRLCKAQDCFRARLTPKPFRCGCSVPKFKFPYETDEEKLYQQNWVKEYDKMIKNYATCKYLGEYGSEQTLSEIEKIIQFHDQLTKINEELTLA